MPSAEIQQITESLYKQNREIADKNKTLALLGELYETSILTLEPKQLAKRITETIQVDLGFELVGIYLYNKTNDELNPLAIAVSKRVRESQTEHSISLETIKIENASKNTALKNLMEGKIMAYTEKMTDIWAREDTRSFFNKIEEGDHIRSSILYPLISESTIVGVLVLCLNRVYSDLVEYERDSIKSFINVIAVALDKTMLYEQLKIANQEKSEFMSFASHEIRNPVTAMRGYASMVLEGDVGEISDDMKDVAEKITSEGQHVLDLIGQYLNKSKLELGELKYNFVPCDMAAIVKASVSNAQINAKQHQLKLSADIDTKGDYKLTADEGKIKEVISNLIDNSIKYTPKGSVTVSISKKDGKVLVKIADTGVGIPKEIQPELFKKFSRANAQKVNLLGTGLGLYLARTFVNAHGGKVWAESEGKDKGSQFYVELPVQPDIKK